MAAENGKKGAEDKKGDQRENREEDDNERKQETRRKTETVLEGRGRSQAKLRQFVIKFKIPSAEKADERVTDTIEMVYGSSTRASRDAE